MTRLGTSGPRIFTAAAFAALLLAAAPVMAQETQGQDPPAAADLPPAQELIDRAVKAMGGEEAIDAIESSMIKASLQAPQGTMNLTVYAADPDKLLVIQAIPQVGEMKAGSNGKVTWAQNPMTGGFQLLQGDEANEIKQFGGITSGSMFRDMDESFKTLETTEKTTLGQTPVYKVKATTEEGSETTLLFNAETGLPAGFETVEEGPMGSTTVTIELKDWKNVGDVKTFSTIVIHNGMQTMEVKVEKTEFNNVDPSMFELPAEVKSLAEQQGETDDGGDDDGGGDAGDDDDDGGGGNC